MENTELKPYETMIAVFHYLCLRCGHAWQPKRKGEMPGVCPHCNSARWDRPKKIKITE